MSAEPGGQARCGASTAWRAAAFTGSDGPGGRGARRRQPLVENQVPWAPPTRGSESRRLARTEVGGGCGAGGGRDPGGGCATAGTRLQGCGEGDARCHCDGPYPGAPGAESPKGPSAAPTERPPEWQQPGSDERARPSGLRPSPAFSSKGPGLLGDTADSRAGPRRVRSGTSGPGKSGGAQRTRGRDRSWGGSPGRLPPARLEAVSGAEWEAVPSQRRGMKKSGGRRV